MTDIYNAWSACDSCVIWPPPPSRLTCVWPQERPLVGHLLEWAYDMRTFQSQIWGLHQWMLCSGTRAESRGTEPFSLAGPPLARILWEKRIVNMFSFAMLIITPRSRFHLQVWILIVLSTIILRAFIFFPKIFSPDCLLHSSSRIYSWQIPEL